MRTRTRTVVVALVAMAASIPATALPVVAHAAPTALAAATAAATTPGSITLAVQSARTVRPQAGFVHAGDPVTSYQWIINEDATGDPGTSGRQLTDQCLPGRAPGGASNPDYADTCPWPSTRTTSGFAPVVAQGDQSALNRSKALEGLAPGKYLISVTAKDFKIDGAHFTVTPGGAQVVSVGMNPTPLPLSTIKIQVFEDNAPVDGTYEVGAEQGRAAFTANLTDVFGPVSVDYYGNALCTVYQHSTTNPASPIVFDANDRPVVDQTRSTGRCTSDSSGVITIPNLGPNRYAALVTPPAPVAGQTYQWVQTTTLEGAHDHDIWIQEGSTGLDTEVVKGAEPVPAVQFGFVRTKPLKSGAKAPTGEVKGTVVAGLPYIGGQNGQVTYQTPFASSKVGGVIKSPWVALSDLGAGDAAVYVGRGATNGSFDIKNVPDGSYQLTLWDDDQDYILWSFNVTVTGGQVVDVGQEMLVGWFTHVYGSVFIDSNGNGVRDPGETGVPNFTLTLRERDNSQMDQYTNTVTTNTAGSYDVREGYPLSKWLVLEAFNTRYRTTGVTWQAENETEPTTQLGGLVDLSVLPVIGLGGRVDWGVEPVPGAENGGIAGTVTYDVTRNELDPADAATEGYQPGIPGLDVHLYASKPCTATTTEDQANTCRGTKEIVPLKVDDGTGTGTMVDNPDPRRGALARGPELADATTTEEYAPPRGCTARLYNGDELTDQLALPQSGADANRMCVESPMMGFTAGASDSTEGAQTVNGNYGFSQSKLNQYPVGDQRNPAPGHDLALYADLAAAGYDPQPLVATDYLVGVDIPDNPVGGGAMYKVTSEESVNVFTGDSYLPQENFPPATPAIAADPGGPPTPDVTPPSQPPSQTGGIVSGCAGPLHKVDVTDEDFLANGGSPFQGQDRPS
ncbi:MAG: SdrD B-like domain-containing protein, partial [Pedococcus sp.]